MGNINFPAHEIKTISSDNDLLVILSDLHIGQNTASNLQEQLNQKAVAPGKTTNYEQEVKKIQNLISALNLPLDPFDTDAINNFKEQLNIIKQSIHGLDDEKYIAATAEQIDQLSIRISKLSSGNTAMDDSLKIKFKELSSEVKILRDNLGNVNAAELETAKIKLVALEREMREAGKLGISMGDKIKKKLKDVIAYFSTYVTIYDFIRILRQGLTTIKEYDTALTEMNKVSNESIKTLKEFQSEAFNLADEIGTTSKQIQQSAADFMRLGESFEQAKQSAQDANILFQVSEFDSIDAATESLVAMSAAYKDLEKSEINDVLNEIGNNYSISTDQLATALQKSAATLSIAGNDIYEATALITAGNAILQDSDTVGTGMKMISLRILGTEEAKNELASLGEDVDDFVVQTKSKLDQTIRDYTAVASNDFKGVSVLDENGNYRSTYEILRDIAKVYQEILEADKKAGTNRGQALLEVLAGKNRSNVAASILQNPELLESVYESAKNSKGSAQEELDKQLESIEGHLNQLKNAWDEIWINENNRETINFFLDLAKAILEVVNELGGLKALLIGGAGIFAGFKNFGTSKMFDVLKYAEYNMCSLGY